MRKKNPPSCEALLLNPAPHPHQSNSLNNLGNVLFEQFEQSGRHQDLEEAISLYRKAFKLLPAHHPLQPSLLNNLASALYDHGQANQWD